MKIAFAIVKYFPYGGVQLDMMRMAQSCAARGHKIVIFCHSWEGEKPECAEVRHVKLRSLSNCGRVAELGEKVHRAVSEEGDFDGVIGFVRTVHLDGFFGGDNCFRALGEERSLFYRLFSWRYRKFLKLEEAVFGADSKTVAMIIVDRQFEDYRKYLNTPPERMRMLPPGIQKSCVYPEDEAEAAAIRTAFRHRNKVADDEKLLVLVGTHFHRKGGDRLIRAAALLPDELRRSVHVMLAGSNPANGRYRRLAEKLGVKLTVYGKCDDVKSLLLGADMMVHPAREETAGSVLLEALAMHLPVVVSGCCGWAKFVGEAGGIVLPEPYQDTDCSAAVAEALDRLPEMRRKAKAYAESHDFYSRAEAAADIIEEICAKKSI